MARWPAATSLAAWREAEAIRKDRPPQWIMRDSVLLDIAWNLPRTEDELLQQAEGLVEAIALVPSERQISRERLTRIQEALQVRGVGLVVLSGTDNVISVDLPGELDYPGYTE